MNKSWTHPLRQFRISLLQVGDDLATPEGGGGTIVAVLLAEVEGVVPPDWTALLLLRAACD
jgi:hypothetical protein